MTGKSNLKFNLDIQFFAGTHTFIHVDGVEYEVATGGIMEVLQNGLQSDNATTPFWRASTTSTRIFDGVSTTSGATTAEYPVGSEVDISDATGEHTFYSVYSVGLNRSKIISKIQTDVDTYDIIPNKMANASGNYYAELPTLTQNETIATGTQLATKQDTLVSGTNIKTINGQNILGSGNVTIDAGVSSVNGKTGAVTLTKGDVGLGNVDNTSDLDKPISTATQAALDELEDEMTEASVTVTDSSMSKVSGIDDGLALPEKSQMEMLSIKGNTIAWNQMVGNVHDSMINSGITFTKVDNKTITISGTATARVSSSVLSNSIPVLHNHKYLIKGMESNSQNIGLIFNAFTSGGSYVTTYSGRDTGNGLIVDNTNASVARLQLEVVVDNGTTLSKTYTMKPIVIDLTLAYPTDTPTTLTDPRVQWCINFALQHPELASRLVDVNLNAYETTGRNLFDYDSRIVGKSINSDGSLYGDGTRYTMFARVLPNTTYTKRGGADAGYAEYDIAMNFLGISSGNTFTTKANTAYLGVSCLNTTTDPMLNAGSTALPYEPYVKHTYPLSWNGKSAGSVQDEKLANGKEITRTKIYTFSGNESWSTGDNYFYCWTSGLSDYCKDGTCVLTNGIIAKTLGNGYILVELSYNPQLTLQSNMNQVFGSGVQCCFALATPIETDGDPLPNAIAVYQGGTEWQINDGAPCGIYKDYDISIKDQVLTNVKVDARQEEEIGELKQADLKTLYNLGEFDSVDTSNKDYDLITRATMVIDAEDIEWSYSSGSGRYYKTISGIEVPSSDSVVANIKSAYYATLSANANQTASESIAIDYLGEVLIKTSSTPKGVIQIKLATPYTEKVIKNRPLDTLDQNGSMFVRKEWEKGLQLWDEQWEQGCFATQGVEVATANAIRSKNFIAVKPNAIYTLNVPNVASNTAQVRVIFYNNPEVYLSSDTSIGGLFTFTTPSNCHYIKICTLPDYSPYYGGTYNNDIMLNEGSHTYPYQPYNGDIVHQKELETKQDTLVSGTNIKTIGGQSILGSGNLDVGAPTTEFTAAEVDALFA